MKTAPSLAIKFTISALLLYLLGFFLLYPLFAKFTAGENPGFALAISAQAVHKAIYQPLLIKLGPEHPVSELWLGNARWWCNRINGLEQCREPQE
jgi:hypothetical protein